MNLRLLALSIIVFIPLYLIRYDSVRPSYQAGQRVRVKGQIDQDPTVIERQQKISIAGIKIYTDITPEYQYGDQIKAEGIITQGKTGWYLKSPVVEKLESGGVLFSFRQKILGLYKNYLPQPHEALLAGIVLGTKSSLENNFYQSLRNTGTLHVVVASGTNIALFSGALINFTAFLWGRKRSILTTSVLIWLYVILIGFQAPIVRAAIMGSVAFFWTIFGKRSKCPACTFYFCCLHFPVLVSPKNFYVGHL